MNSSIELGMLPTKPMHEIYKITDIEILNSEISARCHNIGCMVGNLYPAILRSEIVRIKLIIKGVK